MESTHNKRLQRTRGTVGAASVRAVALTFEAWRSHAEHENEAQSVRNGSFGSSEVI